MPRRRAREQRANRSNRLPVAPNDPSDIALAHLQAKDCHAAIGNLREHDFIGEFDELPNDELEKLSHVFELSDGVAGRPIPDALPGNAQPLFRGGFSRRGLGGDRRGT